MRSRVANEMLGWLRSASETVVRDTPASSASCRTVGRTFGHLKWRNLTITLKRTLKNNNPRAQASSNLTVKTDRRWLREQRLL